MEALTLQSLETCFRTETPSKAAEPLPHLQLPARSSAGCVAQCLRAACQVHSCDPSSVSCSRYGELRAWPTGERVLLELSGDDGAKNCCGSPSPSGPTICASDLGIPSRPWIIFRTDGGLPDHLACGSTEAAQENHSRSILKQTDARAPLQTYAIRILGRGPSPQQVTLMG